MRSTFVPLYGPKVDRVSRTPEEDARNGDVPGVSVTRSSSVTIASFSGYEPCSLFIPRSLRAPASGARDSPSHSPAADADGSIKWVDAVQGGIGEETTRIRGVR
jgi:hypothetical protein